MKTYLAFDKEEARQASWQAPFPKTTDCCRCKGKARLGFVVQEEHKKGGKYVCQIYENKPKSMWLHDCCAVAIYFCKECLETTALYNQA